MRSMWDGFVARSRQRSFLFLRDYMEYHSDRFEDASLLVFNDSDKLLALLPANRDGNCVCSHGGLTYGGFVTPVVGFDSAVMLEVWQEAMQFYKSLGIERLLYKPAPWIYPVCPADDDLYALFRADATQTACGVSSAIDLRTPLNYNDNSRRNLRKAQKLGCTVEEAFSYGAFWQLLGEVLYIRHGVHPVHSLAEIEYLASCFPENIRLYVVRSSSGELLAGSVLYITPTVVHLQYIASSATGKSCGALALLFDELISKAISGEFALDCLPQRYFDFGISTENGGAVLNEGLHHQKSGFGARTVAYPQYAVCL